MNRHATGITLILTVALAVGLSFAPVPEWLRPIPSLERAKPAQTVARAFLPKLRGEAKPSLDPIAPPEQRLAADSPIPANGAPSALEVAASDDGAPAQPPPPAFALGAAEARNVRRLERLVAALGAQHVDLEEACVTLASDGTCARRALDDFFGALGALQRGELQKPVRVVHLGDSQIASDYISDTIRRRLQLRYGSAGPGFLFVDRPTKFAGRKVRTGDATDGWEVTKLTDKERAGLLGFSGVRFTATEGRQRTRFDVGQARFADISFATDQRGGTLEVRADETRISQLFTRFTDQSLAHARIALPAGTRSLSLNAVGGKVSVFGVSLETGGPGVTYDSVGLPGAMYEVFLRAPESTFGSQLRHRNPSLVVLMLGGNEAYEMGRGWQTIETVKKNAAAFAERLHAASPNAACLMLAPMDAGTRTVGGEIQPREHTQEVAAAVREVALANGCAYWDLYSALGGAGAAGRWRSKGLFNEDLVHPLPAGAEVIGHLFDFALERARAARPLPSTASVDEQDLPGLVNPEGRALRKTLAKLAALKADPELGRVNIVQLGASHTASHMFTDAVRKELTAQFGSGGRGFIAAGRPSERLAPAHVRREAKGEWQLTDAREVERGGIFGLTGARAVGQPGAAMTFAFGVGQEGGAAPATLSLYVLEAPAQPSRMAIRIDGKTVLLPNETEPALDVPKPQPAGVRETAAVQIERSGRRKKKKSHRPAAPAEPTATLVMEPQEQPVPEGGGRVRVLRFAVRGTSHTIEVENAGATPLTVFGAALEQDQGGLVYDALGLPGATAHLVDGYDRESFVDQLRTRNADLYVLFFGTNESAEQATDPVAVRAANRSLLGKLKDASPFAECLIIGPTDRLVQSSTGAWLETPANTQMVKTLRTLAAEEGCAFWSARAAMGGVRSMSRWQSVVPQLGHEDGVHLTRDGYEVLAHGFSDELLNAFHLSQATAEAR